MNQIAHMADYRNIVVNVLVGSVKLQQFLQATCPVSGFSITRSVHERAFYHFFSLRRVNSILCQNHSMP
jgi:hypothetical protein